MSWTEEQYAAYVAARKPALGTTGHAEPERVLLTQVLALATQCGWQAYHTHDSRRSQPGFPDLVLVKPGHPVIFAELKRDDIKLPTPEQQAWLTSLRLATGVQAHVWRRRDWAIIEGILTQRAAQKEENPRDA